MFSGLLFICVSSLLCFVNSKPVNEVLPHSRDYYAGYIKAITDNFDQLFANERQTRSTDEDDEIEAPKAHEEKVDGSVQPVKRDTKVEVGKPESKTPEKKEDNKKTEVITNEEDKEDNEDSDDKEEKAEKKSKSEPAPAVTAPVASVTKSTTQESDEVPADPHQTQVSDAESENTESEDGSDNEEASEEDENEHSPESQSTTPADEEDEEDARRNFILEHADMKNSPFFPNLLSGYHQNQEIAAPFAGEIGGDDSSNVGPMQFPGGQLPPFAFPYGHPMTANFFPQTDDDSYTGDIRSLEKRQKKNDNNNGCADPHHLQRVLLLPQCHDHHCCDNHCCHDCCHQPCDIHVHDCGHHGCDNHHGGHHELVHDIHHRPIGCPEHYSHESPCLTYPHHNNVGYGFPNGGCGCGCNTQHPVVLHPTYQETHHHNIHTLGVDCGHHGCGGDCGHHDCGHHGYANAVHTNCGCGHTAQHIHVNDIHHVHDQGHHGNHGYHHGADADIHVLPHYGHTCAGADGWNPYWGH